MNATPVPTFLALPLLVSLPLLFPLRLSQDTFISQPVLSAVLSCCNTSSATVNFWYIPFSALTRDQTKRAQIFHHDKKS